MTKKFLTPIGILSASSAPSDSVTGAIYYNSSDKKIYVYNGSAWVAVGTDPTPSVFMLMGA